MRSARAMPRQPLRRASRPLCAALLLIAGLWLGAATASAAPRSVQLEELTSSELHERVAQGAVTALIPIGGTEQSGPHIALGKHNLRARWLAERIAQQLGNAIVAPVVAYVPEGAIDPPTQHMRCAGTLSISDAAFEGLLEGAARSLAQHGFRHIVLLGDHGGYQASLQRVAARLNKSWAGAADGRRVIALAEYYRAADAGFAALLRARGHADAEIGQHAGLADTALSMAVDPLMVRRDAFDRAARGGRAEGVSGDPRAATAQLGQPGLELIVVNSVAAIRAQLGAAPAAASAPRSTIPRSRD